MMIRARLRGLCEKEGARVARAREAIGSARCTGTRLNVEPLDLQREIILFDSDLRNLFVEGSGSIG